MMPADSARNVDIAVSKSWNTLYNRIAFATLVEENEQLNIRIPAGATHVSLRWESDALAFHFDGDRYAPVSSGEAAGRIAVMPSQSGDLIVLKPDAKTLNVIRAGSTPGVVGVVFHRVAACGCVGA